MGQVGKIEQERAQAMLDSGKLRFQSLELLTQTAHIREQFGSVFAAPLRNTDLLGERVTSRLQLLRAGLNHLALRLERFELCDVKRDAAFGETCGNGWKIVAQQIDIEHGGSLAEGLAFPCRATHRCRRQSFGSSSPTGFRALRSRSCNAAKRSRIRPSSPRSVGS